MCLRCVREGLPDRGQTCLDEGTYLANWNGCGACGSRQPPRSVERNVDVTEEEEEEEEERESCFEEETTFKHVCVECEHVVCEHYHKFEVVGSSRQEYHMECVLCGKGTDTIRICTAEEARTTVSSETLNGHAEMNGQDSSQTRQSLVDSLASQISTLQFQQQTEDAQGSDSEWD